MQRILFQLGYDEEKYLPLLKPVLGGKCHIQLSNVQPDAITEVVMRAREKQCTVVATSSQKLLSLLLDGAKGTVDDYAGSIIDRMGMEFLVVNPIEHIVTKNYGRFLYERYFSKFLRREDWLDLPQFTWELFQPARYDEILTSFAQADIIACDIETRNDEDKTITCVGYTAVWIDKSKQSFTQRTVVVPLTDTYNLAVVRNLNNLAVPKVFQNGKYDNAYLLRYNAPIRNWAFDTQSLFHCWYSELPKRLDFITSFTLRKWQYWKDESASTNLMDYYQYNAKDCFGTAMSFLALLRELPQWALENFKMQFPLHFPCLLAEMTGLKVDKDRMQKEEVRFEESVGKQLGKLQTMAGCPNFNPSSPKQVLTLFAILGCGDIKNTKPPSRDKVAQRHPLNKRLMTAVENYRKDRKILTSYLRDYDPKDKTYKVWLGRMFYSLNPTGTDTGRLASRESAFWCGTNMQNQPRDRDDIEVKNIYITDTNFLFGECDYEQAEARDTAYLSGDTGLINAVESTNDFHATNASKFFGVRFEEIVDIITGEVIDKSLRDLAKRVNHGSNYNMGKGVLLDTMGADRVIAAKRLLGLPSRYSLLDTTQHLLNVYEKTYPIVKGAWYDKVKADVEGSGFLVGPTGWHRYCFGKPSKNKRDLNAYVAHPPQSLNAMTLNKAWLRVFYEAWLPNQDNFKLCAQIHDSILFQYREGHEYLAWKVKECMEMDIPVKDTFGITRNLRVPVALKGGAKRWSEIHSLKRSIQ